MNFNMSWVVVLHIWSLFKWLSTKHIYNLIQKDIKYYLTLNHFEHQIKLLHTLLDLADVLGRATSPNILELS